MRTQALRRLAVSLPALLLALAIPAAALLLPPQYRDTFPAALTDKLALLRAPGDRRVVVIGGSSVAFGLRCDLLEEAIPGCRAVNLGLYAGLGTSAMLDVALPEIRPGDVVLISPEQNSQTLSGYFGAKTFWQASEAEPALALRLSGQRRRELLGELLAFASEKLLQALSGRPAAGDGIYRRSAFNAWGDLTGEGREANTMPGGFDPGMPISFDPALPGEDFLAELNRFAAACAGRGARVYYRFCPMNRAALPEVEAARMAAWTQALSARLTFPVLGGPEDCLLESGWFFDTNFHLNAAGAVVYTARLAEALGALPGLEAAGEIPLPQMPAGAESSAGYGEGDLSAFLFEERDGAAFVTGLTDLGRQQTSLTLPGAWEGLPVTAFARDTFAGNTRLQSLTLPDSLRRMEDDSFQGCSALKEIRLRQPHPSQTVVGRDLLRGTEAAVLVPASALSAYQTNYFWNVHALRLRPWAEEKESPLPEEAAVETAAPGGSAVCWADANGGEALEGGDSRVAFPLSRTHLRTNTPMGQRLFRREGWTPLCWNTAPDGSGEDIPFGNRAALADGQTLYCRWVPTAPETDFRWEEEKGEARITAWLGEGDLCAVPRTLGGCPVTRVAAGAFAGRQADTVVLPPTLFSIAQGAFAGCGLRSLWLYDSLYYVYEASFEDCGNLTTLYVGADTPPRYSASYFAAFADKLDWLRANAAKRKLLLFGGSATRYAFDSVRLAEAFPGRVPVNMGVYAYTNALPQLRIIARFLREGDVVLNAPEFDTVRTQFCVSTALDQRFWAMAEADYACFSLLDLRQCSEVFSSLNDFLHTRSVMTRSSWEESPARYDDDGNVCKAPTYNRYGDYVLPREGGKADVLLQTYLADYTVAAFPEATLEALNRVYGELRAAGAQVYFVYAPRNHSALTEASTPEARRTLDAWLRQGIRADFLLDVEQSLYPAQLFYLIDNHLSDEGRGLYMDALLPALREALAE